jgi:altronate dehydratase
MVNALRIHSADSVVVALADLAPGTRVDCAEPLSPEVFTREAIPFGHKVAIAVTRKGETVLKYGASIGRATADIAPGQHVHVHNLRSVRGAAKS